LTGVTQQKLSVCEGCTAAVV